MMHIKKLDIRLVLGLILAGLLCSSGCVDNKVDESFHPSWPEPPALAKIIHRKNLSAASDFGVPGFLDQIGALITGTRRHSMLRPNGMTISDEDKLVVADQELQGLHVFKMNSHKARFISQIDERVFVSPVAVVSCGKLLAISDSALPGVFLMTIDGKLVTEFDAPEGFIRPTGLAYDVSRQELFVSDTGANKIYVFDLEGRLLREFGETGNGIGQFNYPTHLWLDRKGRLYVTDSMNFRVQVFDRRDKYLFEIGKHGDASGHLGVPKGVAVDSYGHIYVVDSYFCAVQVFDEDGRLLLSFGGPGRESGRFQVPTGLMIDREDRIYVGDSYNKRIQVFEYVGGSEDGNVNANNN